jgi:phage gp29-like protein
MDAFQAILPPQEVMQILQGALNGDLRESERLWHAMMDNWPDLQEAVTKIAEAVARQTWEVKPFAERGEDPDAESEKLAKEIERLLWRTNPDITRGERDLEGTIKDLVEAYFSGHYAGEYLWESNPQGMNRVRGVKPLSARFYGYPYQGEDQFQLDPVGMGNFSDYVPFPDYRFLIAINKGHSGHATVAAPFRALVGYWLAATYGLKWMMNFSQIFGIPFRWATAADSQDIQELDVMLSKLGSAGHGAFKTDTTINFEPATTGAQTLPQKVLIDLANQQVTKFILGQTLTSTVADSGSRALGEVHKETEDGRVASISDHVGKIISRQYIPALLFWNYGSVPDNAPEFWVRREEPESDGLADAQRMDIIVNNIFGASGADLPEDYVYGELGIQKPAPGDKIFKIKEPVPVTVPGTPLTPGQQPAKPGDPPVKGAKVKAADSGITWENFPASSGTLGIPRSEMPQIHATNRAAMVSFLRARGIDSQQEMIDPASLKATQAEYSPEKVAGAEAYTGGDRSILVSEDNHVVDGHHQWMAAAKSGKPMKVIRLLAPISRVLMMAHRMPSTTVAAADDPDERAALIARLAPLLKGAMVDEDALANLLAAAWVGGAKEEL